MLQLILHLIGDYVTQSDWMAQNKTKSTWAALAHAMVYSLPFLIIASPSALLVIWLTHLLIDRFRLARYIAYAKNILLCPPMWDIWLDQVFDLGLDDPQAELKKRYSWANCVSTGYPIESPIWMSVWLLILCDNTLHLLINYLSIRFL